MRIARLLSLVLAILAAGVLLAPTAGSTPPFRLPGYVTDQAQALSDSGRTNVEQAVDKLYTDRQVRLWVVYVDSFDNLGGVAWAERTRRTSDLDADDAILAVATRDRSYAFLVPTDFVSDEVSNDIRRNAIEPRLRANDWAGAGVAAAEGLEHRRAPGRNLTVGRDRRAGRPHRPGAAAVAVERRRRRKRREAEYAAARRVDPSDPNALAAVPIDALDDLSKSMVVDVDNAVRTSDNELTLAVEEFGDKDTSPFSKAVVDAKTTLAQAFNVRQILDDAVPETVAQRRDLLTRVIVAAAKADRRTRCPAGGVRPAAGSDHQRTDPAGFDDPADGRPDRAPRTVAAGAHRIARSILRYRTGFRERQRRDSQTTAGLRRPEHHQRQEPACASVGSPARPRRRHSRSGVGTRSGAHAAGCGVSAATDINRAIATLPPRSPTSRKASSRRKPTVAGQHGPRQGTRCGPRRRGEGCRRRTRRGHQRPVGRLHQVDAGRRRAGPAAGQRRRGTRGGRTAQPLIRPGAVRRAVKVRAVSDYIDTRRGSIGPEARTRLAEAVRQLQAAQDKRRTESQRGNRACERRGDAGRAGAVDGDSRRAVRAARIRRAIRQHRRKQYGRGARRHHPRQHPVRLHARRARRQHGGGGWSSTSYRRVGGELGAAAAASARRRASRF